MINVQTLGMLLRTLQAGEAPGRGAHWGMATPHQNLPRGTRVNVGTSLNSSASNSYGWM